MFKEIVILGSYCNTNEKLAALEKAIIQAKSFGQDVMVFGRYPIPERIQKMCDYWIFDKSNPVMEDRALNHWMTAFGKRMSNWFLDYGFAAMEQITKTLGFAKSLNYDIAYWFVYDVDLEDFPNYRRVCLETFETQKCSVVCDTFFPVSCEPPRGISTTVMCYKVAESYDKLKGIITETFYRHLLGTTPGNFIAEDFLKECFRVTELKYHMLEEKPNMPATLTSTGSRKHGGIPPEAPKTKNYIDHFFIGESEDTNMICIFIFGIHRPIQKMRVDFGEGLLVELELNGDGLFEKHVEFKPTRCIVQTIDGEEINETLDIDLDERYWQLNKIKNL
jgi:hypothetical protein